MSTTAEPSADLIRRHFDDFAPEYHRTAFDGAGMAHLSLLDLSAIRAAAARTRPTDPRRAVDVGVGTGRISAELRALGFDVIGVDASEGMLAQAAGRLDGVDLRHGSLAESLPVADGTASLVTCLRVVKYLPDWQHAVGELARVAAPGGIVCFDLANAASPARLGYPSGMVWPVRWNDAVAAIDTAGLDLLDGRPGVHVPDPVWRMARTERRAAGVRAAESLGTAVFGRVGARSWTFTCRRRGSDTAAG